MAKRILVIDDDQGILDAFEAMLDSVGYVVQTSRNADSVKRLDSASLPDLILLDVLLSGQDGRDVAKYLKGQKKTKSIPIIMVSAHPGIDKSVKESGADDFLPKPFDMDILLEKIEKFIGKSDNMFTM